MCNGENIRSVGLDGLHLNTEEYVLVKSILLGVVHTEVRAIEVAAGVGAAHLFLEHWMLDAFKRVDRERNRFCHTMERQIAADRLGCAVHEIDEFSLVFRRGKLRWGQYFGARSLFVQ